MIFINSNSVYQIPSKLTSLMNPRLESTDVAPEVSYPRPTRLPACRTVSAFFFSRICTDSARFAPMRLDSCRIGFDSCRNRLIRPKSSRIGHIGSYRPAADTADTAETGQKTAEICRKRPKSALNMARIRNLHSSFFF